MSSRKPVARNQTPEASSEFEQRFAAHAERLLPIDGSTLVVAVSGGADSVALLDLLARLARWTLVVYHLDHALREESPRDAEFVRRLTAELGCDAVIERRDIAIEARLRRCGIEEAGRRVRYLRLAEVARRVEAEAVLTAHHRDDQAETVLMNLVRGAGEVGARGLPEKRMTEGIPVIRPLLPCSRAELREHLHARGRRWLEDASNADDRFRRNVIRQRVLPLLEEAEPGFTEALLRWSATRGAAPTPSSASGGELALAEIGAEPTPARGARWRALLTRLAIEPSRERIRRIDELSRGRPGRRLHLGRWLLRRERHAIAWEPSAPSGSRARVEIAAPGSYHRGDETLTLTASAPPASVRTPRGEAWLDADAIRWPLAWRLAEAGDSWRPLGSPGRQTVRKHLADRKVPARTRALVAVVADAEGVIWIPGHGVAERVKLTATTKRALHGRLIKAVDESQASRP